MSFQHTVYNTNFLEHLRTSDEPLRPDPAYNVRVQPAEVTAGTVYWRMIGVHHLAPDENRGRHHVFVEVLDEAGQRVRDPNLKMEWTWEDSSESPITSPLDKPHNEPAGNIPIHLNMKVALWLTGDGRASDRVTNLHAQHADEPAASGDLWNSYGHHSFYVVFQRTTKAGSEIGDNGHAEIPGGQPGDESHHGEMGNVGDDPLPQPASPPAFFPEYIFGIHESTGGGEQNMLDAGRPGWVLELASVGLDGGGDNANFSHLSSRGLGVIVRLHNGYEPAGALPRPEHYDAFANACATFVTRSAGCHVWVIGNEPNHKAERPGGHFITPHDYADAYTRCRRAIHQVPGHADDLVLVAGPAPWNIETKYDANPSGDWVQYFADTIDAIPVGQCDGFAIHTYTFEHHAGKIRADIYHGNPSFSHRRYQFRTYRDYMEAIPARCRHLPVLITETDPTDPNHGWGDGANNGWVREAYREIAEWNRNPAHQPIQALCLYRWPDPHHHGQRQWSIADRPGVIEDFRAALRAEPAADYRVRMAKTTPVVVDDGTMDDALRQRALPVIPNIFTNQHLINAFFFAAQTLGVVGDDLMRKAGLDVHQLAADEATRQARYRGSTLAQMPNLSPGERTLVTTNLVRELRNVLLWRGQVSTTEGLNLRTEPTTSNSTVLTTLPHRTPLDVLHRSDGWLLVAADAETAGFVSAEYVAPLEAEEPAPVGDGYFRTDPQARSVPLAPPEAERIDPGAAAGPGARNLARIWNRYGGLLALLAERLQIDPLLAVAVLAVESAGAGFGDDGRMIIRFENHLFYRNWGEDHETQFFQHFDFNRATNQSWKGHRWRPSPGALFEEMHGAGGQALEWRVLEFAARLNDTAAKRSISMGAPQILGSNHARLGYATVQEMFDAFADDERNHILGLFDFIRTSATLVHALRGKKYVVFAEEYNGPGQAEYYGTLIRNAVEAASLLRQSPAMVPMSTRSPVAAPLPPELDANIAFLPMPELPDRLVTVIDGPSEDDTQGGPSDETPAQRVVDPREQEIHLRVMNAWAEHMERGLRNNGVMFSQLLRAFMRPYYMTIIMYALLFLVGVGLFVTAAWLSTRAGSDLSTWLFGGLGVVTFLAFFISRPLAALEENLMLITRLGIIYNTYWTRLLYMRETRTIQADLEDATNDTITELERLTDKSVELAENRPGLGMR